jgi:DNA-binding HxlR family transcriptional regulator
VEARVLLGKKWALHIIKELSWHGKKRYSELKRALEGVSPKTLTERLRELEREDVIVRIVYPEVPPRVEYDLTDKGQDLSKSIDSICDWARKWYPDEVNKA